MLGRTRRRLPTARRGWMAGSAPVFRPRSQPRRHLLLACRSSGRMIAVPRRAARVEAIRHGGRRGQRLDRGDRRRNKAARRGHRVSGSSCRVAPKTSRPRARNDTRRRATCSAEPPKPRSGRIAAARSRPRPRGVRWMPPVTPSAWPTGALAGGDRVAAGAPRRAVAAFRAADPTWPSCFRSAMACLSCCRTPCRCSMASPGPSQHLAGQPLTPFGAPSVPADGSGWRRSSRGSLLALARALEPADRAASNAETIDSRNYGRALTKARRNSPRPDVNWPLGKRETDMKPLLIARAVIFAVTSADLTAQGQQVTIRAASAFDGKGRTIPNAHHRGCCREDC
jgi:hypothetical protein